MIKIGNACHADMSQVMANARFDSLTYNVGGYKVLLPTKAMFNDGRVKKGWLSKIRKGTVAAAMWLADNGAEVTCA